MTTDDEILSDTLKREEKFVSYTTFWAVIGGITGLCLIIAGYLFNQNAQLRGEFSAYKEGMFVQLNQITVDVSTVKTDVAWMRKLFDSVAIEVKR